MMASPNLNITETPNGAKVRVETQDSWMELDLAQDQVAELVVLLCHVARLPAPWKVDHAGS